jgi:hypothetical protein
MWYVVAFWVGLLIYELARELRKLRKENSDLKRRLNKQADSIRVYQAENARLLDLTRGKR